MSELIQRNDNRTTIRWKLLTSASVLALIVTVSTAGVVKAEDADRPLIWLELGGDMDVISGQGAVFAPPFLAANPNSPVLNSVTPLQAQQPTKFGFSEDGKITFQPENSDWIFSAAIRYGRSSNSRSVHHQTYNTIVLKYNSGVPHPTGDTLEAHRFADTQAYRKETHAILDFTAGKDVGLGLFGSDSTSTINLGVRIAQFASRSAVEMRARPDIHFKYAALTSTSPHITFHLPYFYGYHATGSASRSFRGVGPMLSWSGSTPFVGNQQDGELTFDWGANAALLFGKQKARVRHQESAQYISRYEILRGLQYTPAYLHPSEGHTANRSVTVPNVGGSIGLSWRAENFKVSMGYRADFFFGAMDTGIDAAKKSNLSFNGPYASISIGLGD